MMISDAERASIPVETDNLVFHSLDLAQKMQGRREVTIAVPAISGILEKNGIQIHKVIFKTTYLNIKIMEISTVLHQFTFNAASVIRVKQVAENALHVTCFDQIPAPKWCILEQLDSWLGFCVIGTLFLLLTYCLFVKVGQML